MVLPSTRTVMAGSFSFQILSWIHQYGVVRCTRAPHHELGPVTSTGHLSADSDFHSIRIRVQRTLSNWRGKKVRTWHLGFCPVAARTYRVVAQRARGSWRQNSCACTHTKHRPLWRRSPTRKRAGQSTTVCGEKMRQDFFRFEILAHSCKKFLHWVVLAVLRV